MSSASNVFDTIFTNKYDPIDLTGDSFLYDGKSKQDYFRAIVSGAIFVDIRNVTDYAKRYQDSDKDVTLEFSQFPMARLPFKKMWLDSSNKVPSDLLNKLGISGFGVLCEALDGASVVEGAVRKFRITIFLQKNKRVEGPINYEEVHCSDSDYVVGTGSFLKNPKTVKLNENNYHYAVFASASSHILMVVLQSLTFMNCKNVDLVDAGPPKRGKMSLKKQKRLPAYRTHVLKIEPMGAAKNINEPPINSSLSEKSLHICRGHFRDYRNGGGLFGKYKNIFWFDGHVRGNSSAGVVQKVYEINQPKAGE